ncbi:MAG: hypothetical protein ACSLFQ_00730 [Thermoanaerobaculia bacterium]
MHKHLRLFTSVLVLAAATTALAQQQVPWRGVVAGASERGERMVVTGRVLDKATGKPIPNAELYVYQADAGGSYGDGPRNPRLKATINSRGDGTYEYSTIRPGSYPNTKILAHIHYVVDAAGYNQWRGEVVFEDDPLLTPEQRKGIETNPAYIVRSPTRDAKGVWQVTADVRMAKL